MFGYTFLRFSYPDYTPILIRAMELWPHDPQVTTPILKLFAELVQNRSQRLQFDISSPNGILLFREASKVICTYGMYSTVFAHLLLSIVKFPQQMRILSFSFNRITGNRIMNLEVPKTQMYPLRLKGISVCFTILKAALCGNYVNFGVCKLYGDETLDNVLDVTTKLILTIPQTDLMVNHPAPKSVYSLPQTCKRLVIFEFNFFLGLSKTSTVILLTFGMFGTRSHGISVDTRPGHFSVHYQKCIWRVCRWRYDEFNYSRSIRW